jgi:hypothetical protein
LQEPDQPLTLPCSLLLLPHQLKHCICQRQTIKRSSSGSRLQRQRVCSSHMVWRGCCWAAQPAGRLHCCKLVLLLVLMLLVLSGVLVDQDLSAGRL